MNERTTASTTAKKLSQNSYLPTGMRRIMVQREIASP